MKTELMMGGHVTLVSPIVSLSVNKTYIKAHANTDRLTRLARIQECLQQSGPHTPADPGPTRRQLGQALDNVMDMLLALPDPRQQLEEHVHKAGVEEGRYVRAWRSQRNYHNLGAVEPE